VGYNSASRQPFGRALTTRSRADGSTRARRRWSSWTKRSKRSARPMPKPGSTNRLCQHGKPASWAARGVHQHL